MTSAALILHDDEPTLVLLRNLLDTAGYQSGAATSPHRMLALDVETAPRLVLLGMAAVEDRDVEIVSLLRRRWPDAWIVALFPAALRERAAHALALGADASLPEPFYPGEILAVARRASARAAAAEHVAPAAEPAPPTNGPAAFRGVEQLTAGIAHMIRNPLQIVELLLESAETDGKLDVVGMREQIGRIEGVVEDLARCAGRRDAPLVPVDVGQLVEGVFSNGRKHGIGPALVERPANERAEVTGAPDLLRAAFEALRHRAERTTPPGGRVEVRVQVRADNGRRFVEVSVADGGPRLSDAGRARLFEPFPDAESLQDGRGLELAAVAGIVRGHGGSTSATSPGPVGTTITVRLPAREDGVAPSSKAKER
jgi:signal transduction histidine kinase